MIRKICSMLREANYFKAGVVILLFSHILIFSIFVLDWAVNKPTESETVFLGIKDVAAYKACVIARKNSAKTLNTFHELYNGLAENKCKAEHGEYRTVSEPISFSSHLSRNEYVFEVALVVFGAVLILCISFMAFLKCDHLGWKRLSIIGALIAGVMASTISYVDDSYETERTVISGIIALPLSMLLILWGRSTYIWVLSGFRPQPEADQNEAYKRDALVSQPDIKYDGLHRWAFGGLALAIVIANGFAVALIDDYVNTIISFVAAILVAVLSAFRYKNIGYSPWYVLFGFVPFVNVVITAQCLILPPGYADHRKLDFAGRIMVTLLLAIAALGLIVALNS